MNRKLFGIGCLVVSSAALLAWCTQPQSSVGENDTNTTVSQEQWDHGKSLQIVSTFPPLYAHTANIIDENDTLTNLVPPGTSVHTWQPKPSDVLAMEEADVIITNGLWLEEFLEDYLDSLEKKWVMIIDTSEWIAYMEFEEEEEDDHDEDGHDAHNHEWPDPHIRLDINNSQLQAWNITKGLIKLDATQEDIYNKNLESYTTKLTRVNEEITILIDTTTIEPFIVFHDAYQYFLQAYNLADKQIWLVQEFHGDNPSQKEIAELIGTITTNAVTTIYTEPQFNPIIVQRLQQETGVQAREIDPIGSELSKDGYVQMMSLLGQAFANN